MGESHFDEYERYLAGLPQTRGRRLTFSEKCGLAWALHQGEDIDTVVRAFGLSRTSISYLKHCLDRRERARPHYEDVRREFIALGPEAFKEKHFPRELWARLQRVRYGMNHLDENQTDVAPRRFGPDPNSKKYQGRHCLEEDGSLWDVDYLSDREPNGWAFKSADSETWHGAERIRGDIGWEPFNHSSQAYDAIFAVNGLESPRFKPGRRHA